jgi:hypothetical protein
LDTGFSHLLAEESAMRHTLVRAAQGLTAAAALFTVLWACGAPPTRPSTIDLNGTWEGTIQPPPEPGLSARLVITGDSDTPIPTLIIGDTVYEPSRSPASFQTFSDFILYVRNGQTLVTLSGQVSPDRRYVSGQISGLAPGARHFTFDRR